MKHKILFNGLLYAPDGTGVSRYAEHMVQQYIAGGYAVDLLLRDDYKAQYGQYDNVIFAGRDIHSSGQRIIAEQWQLRKLYRQYDLVHFPDYATPVLTRTASVSTIHDMAMKTMRHQYTRQQNFTKNILLQNTIHRSAGVVCDSHFSRQELLQYYPGMEHKSRVIHLGVEQAHVAPADLRMLQQWGLQSQQYFLYVGTLAPHKNIVQLIKGFALLCQQGYEDKLVLAGGKGWMYEDIFAEVQRQQLQSRVIFTGYVSAEQLELLYQNAFAFVTMSMYEGFGLPPLEAMVRRLPVVVNDIPVFHETVGDCGLYVDAGNIESVMQQMKRLIDDNILYHDLVVHGAKRAEVFQWSSTAQQTWQFYQDVLGGDL